MYILTLIFSCVVLSVLYRNLLLGMPRRVYIVKNLVKSFVLMVLVIASFFLLDGWDNDMIKCFASLYVSNDLVALVLCRDELPTSTRLHHMTSVLFMLTAFQTDFKTSKTAQMLFYYTYASAWAFPVNTYLGLRLCFQKRPKYLDQLLNLCKVLYPAICIVNWSFQMYLFDFTYESIAYIIFLTLIMYDDIVLIRWLHSHQKMS